MGCFQVKSNNGKIKNNNNNNNNNNTLVGEKKIDIKKFINDAFEQHNYYRKLFNSPPLELNEELITYSQNFANEMSNKDKKSGFSSKILKFGKKPNLYKLIII